MDLFNIGIEDLGLDASSAEGAALSEQLTVLRDRADAIAIAGSVSREQVQRLITEHAIPLDSQRYPTISFTEQASQTNLQPALESTTIAKNELLGQMVTHASELFQRILAWVRKFFAGVNELVQTKRLGVVAENLSHIAAENTSIEHEVASAAHESPTPTYQAEVAAIQLQMQTDIGARVKALPNAACVLLAHPDILTALTYLNGGWNHVFTSYADTLAGHAKSVHALNDWIATSHPTAAEIRERAAKLVEDMAVVSHPLLSARPVAAVIGDTDAKSSVLNALRSLRAHIEVQHSNAHYDHMALLPQAFQMSRLQAVIKTDPSKHWALAAERLQIQVKDCVEIAQEGAGNAAAGELAADARNGAYALQIATQLDAQLYTGMVGILSLARQIAEIHLTAATRLRALSQKSGADLDRRIAALDKMIANLHKFAGLGPVLA